MIRTVLGDLDRADVSGRILTHEHILCASGDMLHAWGKRWLDLSCVEAAAVAVFSRLRDEQGVTLVVDGTPCDLGRSPELIRRVSERSGVAFVASTGLYHFPSVLTCQRTAQDLAEIFIAECRSGMGTCDIRPGVLKCAVDGDGMTPGISKRIRALAMAQRETRLPLYVHCRFVDNSAHEVLDLLESEQADLGGVVLGHATSRLEPDYLESLLKRGCYLDFDQCFAPKRDACAATVAELIRRGYGDRLLLSLDYSIYNDFLAPALTGLDFTTERHMERFAFLFSDMFSAFQKAGCTDDELARITERNPLAWLDVVPR